MDLSSRLRAIVKSGPPKPAQPAPGERDAHATQRGELTYEPDSGRYEASMDLSQIAAMLGGRAAETPFGRCLIVERRYESDRWHGGVRIGDCAVEDANALAILDPSLGGQTPSTQGQTPVVGLRT